MEISTWISPFSRSRFPVLGPAISIPEIPFLDWVQECRSRSASAADGEDDDDRR